MARQAKKPLTALQTVKLLLIEVVYAIDVFNEACDCGMCRPCTRISLMRKAVKEANKFIKAAENE